MTLARRRSAAGSSAQRARECWEILRVHGKTFHMMAKLLGPERGSDIAALYGFARVADDAVDVPAPGEHARRGPREARRMQEELRRAVRGRERRAALRRARRDGAPARDPAPAVRRPARRAADGSRRRPLPHLRGPRALLLPRRRDGRAHDHARRRVPRAAAAALEHAKTLGTAMQLTNILRDVGEDLAARPRLPAGRGPRAVRPRRRTARRRGASTAAFRALMEFEIARARRALRARARAHPAPRRRARPARRSSSRWTPTPPSSRRSARTATTSSASRASLSASEKLALVPAPAAWSLAGGRARNGRRPRQRRAERHNGRAHERRARPARRGRPRARGARRRRRRAGVPVPHPARTVTGAPSSSRTPPSPRSTCCSGRRSGSTSPPRRERDRPLPLLAPEAGRELRASPRTCPATSPPRSETYLALRLLGLDREDERLRAAERVHPRRGRRSRACASSRASTSRCSASSRGRRCPPSRRRSSSCPRWAPVNVVPARELGARRRWSRSSSSSTTGRCSRSRTAAPPRTAGSITSGSIPPRSASRTARSVLETVLRHGPGWKAFFNATDALMRALRARARPAGRCARLRGARAARLRGVDPRAPGGERGLGRDLPAHAERRARAPRRRARARLAIRSAAGSRPSSAFAISDAEGFRVEACQSPVWDTILALIGLVDAGADRADPRLVAARRWIERDAAHERLGRLEGLQPRAARRAAGRSSTRTPGTRTSTTPPR